MTTDVMIVLIGTMASVAAVIVSIVYNNKQNKAQYRADVVSDTAWRTSISNRVDRLSDEISSLKGAYDDIQELVSNLNISIAMLNEKISAINEIKLHMQKVVDRCSLHQSATEKLSSRIESVEKRVGYGKEKA